MFDKIIVFDLLMVDFLFEVIVKYFGICEEKFGMVFNVLKVYVFDIDKLNVFMVFYNDLMFGESGFSKFEWEMIVVVVSLINSCFYCFVVYGVVVCELLGDLVLGEILYMNYCVVDLLDCY